MKTPHRPLSSADAQNRSFTLCFPPDQFPAPPAAAAGLALLCAKTTPRGAHHG